jgi:hypothetical protein
MAKRVAVLGAGVGGLTTAHELAERGYEVVVYERMNAYGEKRAAFPSPIPAPTSGRTSRANMASGFSLASIATSSIRCSAFPSMRPATSPTIWYRQRNPCWLVFPSRRWSGSSAFRAPGLSGTPSFICSSNGVSLRDNLHFLRCLVVMATSGLARVHKEYEWIAYWDFIGAAERSIQYQHLLGEGLTRSLVAMKAETSSTRTIATIFRQMIYPLLDPTRHDDRLLCAPTDIVWIFPWVSYLLTMGVQYRLGTLATAFEAYPDQPRLRSITVQEAGRPVVLTDGQDFDYAVSAIPVDGMNTILATQAGASFLTHAPKLQHLAKLETRWMNGVQFYLKQDIPLAEVWEQLNRSHNVNGQIVLPDQTPEYFAEDAQEPTAEPGLPIRAQKCHQHHSDGSQGQFPQVQRTVEPPGYPDLAASGSRETGATRDSTSPPAAPSQCRNLRARMLRCNSSRAAWVRSLWRSTPHTPLPSGGMRFRRSPSTGASRAHRFRRHNCGPVRWLLCPPTASPSDRR